MSRDYIPRDDTALKEFGEQIVSLLKKHGTDLGIAAEQRKALESAEKHYGNAVTEHEKLLALASASEAKKKEKRASLEQTLRSFARYLQTHPEAGVEICTRLGLHSDSAMWPPSTEGQDAPEVRLERDSKKVTVHFHNRLGAYKPVWAWGAEIHRRKAREKSFRLIGLKARSPYVDETAERGEEYVYMVRYRCKGVGKPGPESKHVSTAQNRSIAA